jgi:hypothetical protein
MKQRICDLAIQWTAAARFCLIIWKYDSSRFLMLAAEK